MVNNVEKAQDSYKSRMAQKWGAPVVTTEFINKCIEKGVLLDTDPFMVVGNTADKEFSTGKIIGVYVCVYVHVCVCVCVCVG